MAYDTMASSPDFQSRKLAFFVIYGSFIVGAVASAWFLSSWLIALASVLAAGAFIDFELGLQLLFPYLGFLSILVASIAFINFGWNFFLVCLCSTVLLLTAIWIAVFYDQYVLQRR